MTPDPALKRNVHEIFMTGLNLWRKWRRLVDRVTTLRGNGAAGDTHAEDVQAHGSVDALLVGEVISGELVDG